MKICLLARGSYAPVRMRARVMASKGHEVHVISLHGGTSENFKVHGVHVWSRLASAARYAAAIPQVWRLLSEIQPDVVDVHGVSSYGMFALLPHGHPVIATSYGTDIYGSIAKSIGPRMIARAVLARANVVYSSTPFIEEYARNRLGVDIGKKLVTRSWGVPTREILRDAGSRRRQIRAEFGVADDERVILHSRHIAELWRPEVLLEAFKQLRHAHPETVLWYAYPRATPAGQELLARMMKRCVELGVGQSVRFLGPQSYERIISIMHAADVYVCIGRDDLLAASVLEAMLTGLVPVLADLPPYREVIESGENGILLERITAKSVERAIGAVLDDFETTRSRVAEVNIPLIQSRYDVEANTDWMLARYLEVVR